VLLNPIGEGREKGKGRRKAREKEGEQDRVTWKENRAE
jgi:hypothetical protein